MVQMLVWPTGGARGRDVSSGGGYSTVTSWMPGVLQGTRVSGFLGTSAPPNNNSQTFLASTRIICVSPEATGVWSPRLDSCCLQCPEDRGPLPSHGLQPSVPTTPCWKAGAAEPLVSWCPRGWTSPTSCFPLPPSASTGRALCFRDLRGRPEEPDTDGTLSTETLGAHLSQRVAHTTQIQERRRISTSP